MLRVATLTALIVLSGVALVDAAWGEEALSPAAGIYARAQILLKQGQIDQAAQTFLMAARTEPKNPTYRQQALRMRRIQELRRFVARGNPSQQWQRSVYSLQLFYLQNGLPGLAVEQAQMAHQKMNNATSALWLAESYLAAGQNAEATSLLANYSGTSPKHAVYHTIALARMGSLEHAQRVSQGARTVNQELTAADAYDYARMWALLGKQDSALLLVKEALEKSPAPAVPLMRQQASQDPDLASLRTQPTWASVLATESKVKQTCSGGSSCSGCPMRGKCGGK